MHELGGPKAISPPVVVKLFEQAGGRSFAVQPTMVEEYAKRVLTSTRTRTWQDRKVSSQ